MSALIAKSDVSQNLFTQTGEDDSFNVVSPETELEIDEDNVLDYNAEEPMSNLFENSLFLRKGDLVELR